MRTLTDRALHSLTSDWRLSGAKQRPKREKRNEKENQTHRLHENTHLVCAQTTFSNTAQILLAVVAKWICQVTSNSKLHFFSNVLVTCGKCLLSFSRGVNALDHRRMEEQKKKTLPSFNCTNLTHTAYHYFHSGEHKDLKHKGFWGKLGIRTTVYGVREGQNREIYL